MGRVRTTRGGVGCCGSPTLHARSLRRDDAAGLAIVPLTPILCEGAKSVHTLQEVLTEQHQQLDTLQSGVLLNRSIRPIISVLRRTPHLTTKGRQG